MNKVRIFRNLGDGSVPHVEERMRCNGSGNWICGDNTFLSYIHLWYSPLFNTKLCVSRKHPSHPQRMYAMPSYPLYKLFTQVFIDL
mmetsp:Transcript_36059/g.75930  ORF Transcript_36059/g.75930 Transcript_36059/m.75930 type:complete len:86 (+) Transcript_36059:2565-2822(+)